MKVLNSISLIVSVAAFVSLSISVPAFSQTKDIPMKERMEGHRQMMEMGNVDKMGDIVGLCIEHADEIGLTDDQIIKMKSVQSEMQKKYAQLKVNLKIAETEFMEIMDVKDFDLKNANSAVKKIAGIKTAHDLEMLKAMKEMRTILTDEQFNKMKKMLSICKCP
jgi:Spy/CpxP family protein refolding chaperone